MTKHKTYFNWSTGKDSALALYYLLKNPKYQVEELITTVNSFYNRVSMHGLRKELLEAQTKALKINATIIDLPEQPTMAIYEQVMTHNINTLKKKGFTHSAFGDIFLEDLKMYREENLAKLDIEAIFPLWKKNTTSLIHEFINLGFKSIVVCASSKYFDKSFVGKIIDKNFIENLPKNVDPCGENGEFHTFCFDGPLFKIPIPFKIGEKVYREYDTPKTNNAICKNDKTGFWYCDLIPINEVV